MSYEIVDMIRQDIRKRSMSIKSDLVRARQKEEIWKVASYSFDRDIACMVAPSSGSMHRIMYRVEISIRGTRTPVYRYWSDLRLENIIEMDEQSHVYFRDRRDMS
jgi:hypothetical protein